MDARSRLWAMAGKWHHGRQTGSGRHFVHAAGAFGLAALPVLLTCCTPPRPDPFAVARDQSGPFLPLARSGLTLPGFEGYYTGFWTPAPDGSCAQQQRIPRDMLVDPLRAASGVNYPLRGVVEADGQASLAYGEAKLVGRFGPNGFAGRADTGNGCSWLVNMTRQPLVGRAPGSGPPPGASVVQGEIPNAPDQALQTEQHLERR